MFNNHIFSLGSASKGLHLTARKRRRQIICSINDSSRWRLPTQSKLVIIVGSNLRWGKHVTFHRIPTPVSDRTNNHLQFVTTKPTSSSLVTVNPCLSPGHFRRCILVDKPSVHRVYSHIYHLLPSPSLPFIGRNVNNNSCASI